VSIVLLLGGARSGKSALALELARRWGGPVRFIATAEAGDEEMRERIRLHRSERPADWTTVEEPLDLCAAVQETPANAALVIDCLTLWVANMLERGHSDREVEEEGRAAAAQARSRAALTVAVSNEVGLGIVPATESGRRYRDVLGRVNADWALCADTAALVVAGRALTLGSAEALL
jgi:adenosylcobinamide kinase / adenosylcobinamide-phosphate guanylyltransferase